MQQTTCTPDDFQQAINKIYLWVKNGCPEHDYFDVYFGLCTNIMFAANCGCGDISYILFKGNEYPFNDNPSDYFNEDNKYTNPKRLAWLKEHQTVE